MKCKIFKDRLEDYIGKNLSADMNKAMSDHIKECAECRKLYEEELEIEKLFKSALETDQINFNSSRQQVIRSIDKNLYGKSLLKKIKFTAIRNRVQIVAAGMAIVVAVSGIYGVLNINGNKKYALNRKSDSRSTAERSLPNRVSEKIKHADIMSTADAKKSKVKLATNDSVYGDETGYARLNLTSDAYVAMFKKKDVSVKYNREAGTPWKKSPNGNLEFSVYGKGESAIEEGEAYLLLKNKNNKMWKIYMTHNNTKQYTPLSAEWFDNNNVLVTVGLGYGTVTVGGDLFLVNVNDAKAMNIYNLYTSTNGRKQIAQIQKKDDNLMLKIREYNDNTLNDYKNKSLKLYFNSVVSNDGGLKEKAENVWQQPIEKLIQYVGNQDSDSISQIFDADVDPVQKQKIESDLQKTKSMQINNLIDITPSAGIEELKNKYPYIRSYIANIDISMNEPGNMLKNGTNYLYITLVSNDSSTEPLIYDIKPSSQN